MADDDIQDAPTASSTNETAGDTPSDTPVKKAAKKAPAKKAAAKKTTAKKAASKKAAAASGDDAPETTPSSSPETTETAETKPAKKSAAKKTAAKKAPAKRAAKKAAAPVPDAEPDADGSEPTAESTDEVTPTGTMPLFKVPEKVVPAKRTRTRKTAAPAAPVEEPVAEDEELEDPAVEDSVETAAVTDPAAEAAEPAAEDTADSATDGPDETAGAESDDSSDDSPNDSSDDSSNDSDDDSDDDTDEAGDTGPRRRRRRGGRRRRRTGSGEGDSDAAEGDEPAAESGAAQGQGDDKSAGGGDGGDGESGDGEGGTSTRRRRKRRREGEDSGGEEPGTTTRVRRARTAEDEITSIQGSTRLEAKKQRRRDGREAGRRRAPIVSEAEFLARRESVDRVMVVRQRDELTQIGVLEDKVLVEHYVARESQTSLIGNIYLGRVQNVLPSMEAAFIDIGKGRNAVLYAGEVNWSQLGHKDGQPRKIESVLSSGQTILVQVSKDPVGHKGARLTSQISLAGRFLVYVPDGTTSGISRKLPDTERNRLKTLLKEVVPSTAGVIVRTAAEGASEDELTQDVERLKARWEEIETKAKGKSSNPQLLHGEPDLTLKVVRDLFTEDFAQLVIQGDDAWNLVHGYVEGMAPDLLERVEKYDPSEHNGVDLFSTYRIDEQIAKAVDRKVFLPSGGSLVIDRTEAMTVVDVNTGKFTGSGGNLEETVTKNNLEAAEEVVRQLRLRDIGGIIVIDFIDMVLEANRDLVLRRMVECLGRDRTRHQVAEVTSLGLVQMTRKRIGTGLIEAFSETCDHCQGRGVVIHDMPVEPKRGSSDDGGAGGGRGGRGGNSGGNGNAGGNGGGNSNASGSNAGGGDSAGNGGADGERRGRRRGGRGRGDDAPAAAPAAAAHKPTPAEFAAMARAESHKDELAAQEALDAADVAEAVEAVEPTVTVAESAVEVVETTPEPVVPAEPKVVTRTRRGVSRTVASTAPAAPVEVSEPAEPTAQPTSEQAAPAEPVADPVTEPAVPAEPRVVTRTRRGVSRTVASAAPVTPVTPVTPVEVAASDAAPVAAPESAPEPPKVVTRTRGGARRTPAAAAEPATEPAAETATETATDAEGETDESGLHVPVKRKGGARKR